MLVPIEKEHSMQILGRIGPTEPRMERERERKRERDRERDREKERERERTFTYYIYVEKILYNISDIYGACILVSLVPTVIRARRI